VGRTLIGIEQAVKHLLAGLIYIVAAESERVTLFMPETETSTHGHVLLHKSDFRHFMLQFATLHACYKVASDLSQWPYYASQTRPFFRENHITPVRWFESHYLYDVFHFCSFCVAHNRIQILLY
jgi:hypothetical protein